MFHTMKRSKMNCDKHTTWVALQNPLELWLHVPVFQALLLPGSDRKRTRRACSQPDARSVHAQKSKSALYTAACSLAAAGSMWNVWTWSPGTHQSGMQRRWRHWLLSNCTALSLHPLLANWIFCQCSTSSNFSLVQAWKRRPTMSKIRCWMGPEESAWNEEDGIGA